MKTAVHFLLAASLLAVQARSEEAKLTCSEGLTLARGPVDEAVFSRAASRGVRAEWCERYDASGRSERLGHYIERRPDGTVRLAATYIDGRLAGPIVAYQENGTVFLRGELTGGDWRGPVSLHHDNGALLWSGSFEGGRLDGHVRLHHSDGGLAGEARFQAGREYGAARSFYSRARGGGLQSEVQVEADIFVGLHRTFDLEGKETLRAAPNAAPETGSTPILVTVPATASLD